MLTMNWILFASVGFDCFCYSSFHYLFLLIIIFDKSSIEKPCKLIWCESCETSKVNEFINKCFHIQSHFIDRIFRFLTSFFLIEPNNWTQSLTQQQQINNAMIRLLWLLLYMYMWLLNRHTITMNSCNCIFLSKVWFKTDNWALLHFKMLA